MKKGLIVAGCLALAVAAGKPAGAQPMAPAVPKFFGNFEPRPGVWSEYAMVEKGSGRKSVMRLSIVGEEEGAYWYEVHIKNGDSRNVIKMLVTGDPREGENVRRFIIKSGDGQAIEMPRDFVAMGRKMADHMFSSRSGVPAEGKGEVRVENVGEGKRTVPAGTFSVQRRRVVGSDGAVIGTFDFSEKVRPIGVVASDSEETSMELLGHGADAVTAIEEEPVLMQPPPGMPPGMGPGSPGMPPGMPAPAR